MIGQTFTGDAKQQQATCGLLPGWRDVVAMNICYQSAAAMGRPF